MSSNQPNQRTLVVQVRILMASTAVLFLLVVGCLAMLVNMSTSSSAGRQSAADTITVSSLLVTDSQGQVRAQLSASESGATLTLLDRSGHQRIALTTESGEPKVALFDNRGRIRLQSFVTNMGGHTQYLGSDGPRLSIGESAAGGGLEMRDYNGTLRVELGLRDYAQGRTAPRSLLNLFTETGDVLYSVDNEP